MNPAEFQIRRATIEDLPALFSLWQSMHFNTDGLDRRLTEFQVAVDGSGNVVGTIGFQLIGKQALLHSEAFADFAVADVVRPRFWERLQTVAANHGTVRVWTKETAPFWSRHIFTAPDAGSLAKLPPSLNSTAGEWSTIKLREDVDEILSLDKEFAMFAESERARSDNALKQARLLKTFATIAAIILAVVVIIASVYLLRRNAQG